MVQLAAAYAERSARQWAVGARRIDYPVAIDNDFEIWQAFANHYWSLCTSWTPRGGSGITVSAKAITVGGHGMLPVGGQKPAR